MRDEKMTVRQKNSALQILTMAWTTVRQRRSTLHILTMACFIFMAMILGVLVILQGVETFIAQADENKRPFKCERIVVEEGTTVDASYLWPDVKDAAFTGIYRNGQILDEKNMVTVEKGSVYHFRGESSGPVLYTQVYVGGRPASGSSAVEKNSWYGLLPSSIRSEFEADGWTWAFGWEHDGRVHLDTESKKILVKESEPSSILYGMGLYLDDKYAYAQDTAFAREGALFTDTFGETDNMFASALEHYYNRSGEMRSACPMIYAMVADALGEMDGELEQIRNDTFIQDEEPEEWNEE